MSIGTLTFEESLAELNNPANAIKYSTIEGLESLVKQVSVQGETKGDAACYFSIDTICQDGTFCPCHA